MNNSNQQSPFWKTDAFIVLALIIFWPVGLFLMWKYAPWRRWVKILLSLFFSISFVLPIIFLLFFTVFFSNQLQKRSSFGPPNSSVTTQTSTKSKVYNFENLGNGYTRVTSQKYKFSFEFPSDLRYFPPIGQEQPGVSESIGFQTEKRFKNDNSASFAINFAPSTAGNPCQEYKTLSNWSPTTINGLKVVKSGKPDNQTIIVCENSNNYSFSYHGAYTPKKGSALTPAELVKEKETYDYILKTFKVLP